VLRSRSRMSALIVAADPSDLSTYNLPPLNASGELARARAALGSMHITALPDESQEIKATLDHILNHLYQQTCDILYLVCHGAWVKGDIWLWLEDAAGLTARVSGSELVERFRALVRRPIVLVLASCQSAAAEDAANLSALGPRMVDAGIPVVLAMQSKISVHTLEKMMPLFFSELQRHGQIDAAVATARGIVQDRLDYWVPVLYTRLDDGCIWLQPGFRFYKIFRMVAVLLS
jgi:hypothetical protein